ncbi:MAG TPA: sigma-70 family RNA polymerase sigma factor [Thermoanaerobaculia bacterium]|nr:sigma-70 family RNA polymerase sigma factor [Thermoanaerobaculia bacterium]
MKLLEEPGTRQLDPLLVPFLEAPDGECREALGRLLDEQARPVLQGILRLSLGSGSAEAADLEAEVVVHLIERLQRLRLEGGAIRDFRGYVAVAAYNALAERWRRREPEPARPPREDGEADPLALLADPAPNAAAALQQRSRLALLWEEIRQLPPRQATALLLNLRDAQRENALSLLPLTGVATIRDIARTLGMSAETLAQIWHRLPYEDVEVATLLGVSRQQVINLRKSARERLARRMRAF